MRVCVLQPVLDGFKGANHLPLFGSLSDVSFTIVCNRSNVSPSDLPKNINVVTVPGRLGPYYYGVGDFRFAQLVLHTHPPGDSFWKGFSLIHLNQTLGPQFLCLRDCGVPLLYAVHHPVTADLEVATQESGIFGSIAWLFKYALLRMWQRRLCLEMPAIMTVSDTVKRRLVTDYGAQPDRITVVGNGVDGSVFTPGDGAPNYDVIALGSFVHPRKGFRYLLEVYRILASQGKRIADVGRRSGAQRLALKDIPGVTMFGNVAHDKLVALLRSSATLVSTSLYEGFGLSLIEALACGRPAFAFDGGAVDEVLGSIAPALVVPARDVHGLADCVESFLQLSPEEHSKKGDMYRSAVLERYGIERSANALRALYVSLT